MVEFGIFIGELRKDKKVTTEGKVILPNKEEIVLEGVTVERGIDLKKGFNEGYIISHREPDQPPMLMKVTKKLVTETIARLDLDCVCKVKVEGE